MPDVAGAIRVLPDDALASPNRSTIPLLDYWREPVGALSRLSRDLGWELDAQSELTFEYEVPVRRGRGKGSFSDLMIVSKGLAVAVEAKYREPPYEDVRTWLGDPPTSNRGAVLGGWLEMIGAATGRNLTVEKVVGLPYQLVHRAASACSVDRPRRMVLYQLFRADGLAYYESALGGLQKALPRSSALEFAILVCPADPTKAHPSAGGVSVDSPRAIREALLDAPFFRFDKAERIRI